MDLQALKLLVYLKMTIMKGKIYTLVIGRSRDGIMARILIPYIFMVVL